ncbi:CRISPR-associated endonuclease Cas3'' [Natrinema soli]|uniref:CRISPR-associated endonuclease Cas3 n=1 Tax=Natrinema soli TaxID=1930624 RepID=A0ABD5SNM5_9EURY|nr:CRISPR-associated endonuclease Cas3'' [Natrinema soli]
MDTPLISNPTRNEDTNTYTEDQLTEHGNLRLTAHNRVVAERVVRLLGNNNEASNYLHAAAVLHDFGKATPQFQAYVRPEETTDCPDMETTHAHLGALTTWYVLGEMGAPDQDRLAGTLAVARHHQALPNAAQYTAEPLARENGIRPLIKHREFSSLQKAWNARLGTELYDQPSQSERVNSRLKRRYGAFVRSRRWWKQFRELVLTCIVHNLDRAL